MSEDGRDYFFLTEDEFQSGSSEGDFLEWAEFAGHFYGTPKRVVEEQLAAGRDVILEIELEGADRCSMNRPDALMIFIMPPSLRGTASAGCEARKTESRRPSSSAVWPEAKEEMEAVLNGVWQATPAIRLCYSKRKYRVRRAMSSPESSKDQGRG